MKHKKTTLKIAIGLSCLALLAARAACSTIVIDDFDTPFTTTVNTQIDGPSLGGEVDVNFFFTTGTAIVSSGVFSGNSDDLGPQLSLRLDWDGDDSNSSITFGGLGADLTSAGGNDRFLLSVVGFTGTPEFRIRLFDDSQSNSLIMPSYQSITSAGLIEIPFATFTTTGSGADFSNVGSLSLFFRLDNGDEISISNFGAVPEPSSAVLLGIATLFSALVRRRIAPSLGSVPARKQFR